MRTVWMLEEGEYSDYKVLAIFEREEDAQATLAAGLGDNVNTLPLYETGEEPKRTTVYLIDCWLADNGDFYSQIPTYYGAAQNRLRTWSYIVAEWDRPNPFFENRRPSVTDWRNGEGTQLNVSGIDQIAVIKAFRDRFAQWQVLTESACMMPDPVWGKLGDSERLVPEVPETDDDIPAPPRGFVRNTEEPSEGGTGMGIAVGIPTAKAKKSKGGGAKVTFG